MEYYFGDFNLPRDKFLQEETKSDDGWVSFDFVATTCPCLTYFDVTGFFVVLVHLGCAGDHGDHVEVQKAVRPVQGNTLKCSREMKQFQIYLPLPGREGDCCGTEAVKSRSAGGFRGWLQDQVKRKGWENLEIVWGKL